MKHLKIYENKSHMTIYDYMCDGNCRQIKKLINNGEDINKVDDNGQAPLHYACDFSTVSNVSEKENYDIVKLLIDSGANLNVKDYSDVTPLMFVMDMYKIDIAILLTKNGADWKYRDKNGDDLFSNAPSDIKETLILEFPDKYDEYLIWLESEKYNL